MQNLDLDGMSGCFDTVAKSWQKRKFLVVYDKRETEFHFDQKEDKLENGECLEAFRVCSPKSHSVFYKNWY